MAATSQSRLKFEDYDGFVEKFKPKRTTDDCYTPQRVYDAVLDWVCREYSIDPGSVVRPFRPGGDYESEDYTDKVVVDNPPFSILASILDTFGARDVPYFLWAPHLTILGTALRRQGACALLCGCACVYENGAKVRTSFVTNMEPTSRVRSAPSLFEAVTAAQHEVSKTNQRKPLTKWAFPEECVRQTDFELLARNGVDFALAEGDFVPVSALDGMRSKSIFGGGCS